MFWYHAQREEQEGRKVRYGINTITELQDYTRALGQSIPHAVKYILITHTYGDLNQGYSGLFKGY